MTRMFVRKTFISDSLYGKGASPMKIRDTEKLHNNSQYLINTYMIKKWRHCNCIDWAFCQICLDKC